MTDVLIRTTGSPVLSPPARELSGSVAEGLMLAVAPTTGRFKPVVTERGPVEAGALLGHVTGGQGRADAVTAPTDATLRSLLVRPGQLVRAGQALAWLERPL
jgi:biotin carboxyl carrier protein